MEKVEQTFENSHGETMTMTLNEEGVSVKHSDVDDNFRGIEDFLVEVNISEEESNALFDFCTKQAEMDDMQLLQLAETVNQRRTIEHNKVMIKMLLGDFRNYFMENNMTAEDITDESKFEETANGFIESQFEKAMNAANSQEGEENSEE